jgi:histidinol dehydrogenase
LRLLNGLEDAYRALLRPAPWLDPPVSDATLQYLEGVFGEPITANEAVRRVISEVHENGDGGIRDLARRFDGVDLSELELRREEIARAYDRVDTDVIDALHLAANEIEAFHRQQSRQSWLDFERGVGQMIRPIHRAGIFAPGGLAAYPSTVLMTAIPAKVAGVPEVILSTLGRDRGEVPPVALVAASIAKVDRVFRIGGPPAIAAMAIGTESVPKVAKVFGPGNLLVQLVKRAIYGVAGVDALQGPSETIVLADDRANPALCAADLLAQAEHDADSRPILVTTSERLVPRVEREIRRQLADLPDESPAHLSIETQGASVVVDTLDEAISFSNAFAPEHLCLLVRDPWSLVHRITAAGGVFVGEGSPEVLGDYVAGPSHVMPTAGAAFHSSPVSVFEFLKVTSVVNVPPSRVQRIGPAGVTIARAEGMPAHANAIQLRLDPRDDLQD